MAVDLCAGLCSRLGYQPETVLSVHVTARKAVVIVDDAGDLRRAVRPLLPALQTVTPGPQASLDPKR